VFRAPGRIFRFRRTSAILPSLTQDQLQEIRRWAGRLRERGGSPELVAAARAIELLAGEVDRLRAEADARDERARSAEEEAEAEERRREREREDRAERRLRRDRSSRAQAILAPPPAPPLAPPRPSSLPEAPETPRVALRPERAVPRPRRRSRRAALGRRRPAAPAWAAALLSRRTRPATPPWVSTVLRRPRRSAPPAWLRLRLVAVVAGILVLAVTSLAFGARAAEPDLEATGPAGEAKIGAARVGELVFSIAADSAHLTRSSWELNGEDVTEQAELAGGAATFRGEELPDGEYRLTVDVPGRLPLLGARREWRFTVDRVPPEVSVDPESLQGRPLQAMRVTGSTEDGATVRVGDRAVAVEDGRFAIGLPEPPAEPIQLVVADAAGNETAQKLTVTLVPRKPRAPIRSVHVTFHAWADPTLRKGIVDLIDQGKINSVELDLKDESGIVGFDAKVPFARQIGAVQNIYDLREAIEFLHERGIYVIGRIVAFRDPVHATAAWKRGWKAQVVQTPDGKPYAGYGGFTNFANPVVRQYNIDVAKAAADLGIDDILYDYIRRPDGPTRSMRFPGLKTTPERSIATFLGQARRQLRPYEGLFLGASVFGVAATRPHEIAQDIPAMARNVDYIAPMLYPSHWGPGEYDVSYPNAEPYAIVHRSLKDFQEQTKGTGARVVPWLQDFTLGVSYGPAEVRAQIRASRDAGIPEWILWDPLVTYTADALDRGKKMPPIKTRPLGPPKANQAAGPAPAPKPKATPAASPQAAPPADPANAAKVKANELGVVPVLMYHQIRADGGGDYDMTPAQFRAELARLHKEGYRPVRAIDFVRGTMDVPAGKTPVVMTFDDSTKEQFALGPNGKPKPDTAIGIMLDFARKHPDFKPAGTFFVNDHPFAGVAEGPKMLRWLHENGFELGNHTDDHVPFAGRTPAQVQASLTRGAELIRGAVPGAEVRTMALPLGVMPTPPRLARQGKWNGKSYRHEGVFLVGAEPASSPFAASFRPGAIPRIRSGTPGGEYGSTFWLDQLKRNPERRYVSDGDPKTISFPRGTGGDLAPRFRPRARPY
jgi:peptidoglycan/xylan/chitin deacetylase (PgdA/CDA1 family)